MLKYCLAAVLTIGLALPVISQTTRAPAAVAKASVQQKALELARIVGSEENVIGDEKSDKKAADFAEQMFTTDKNIAELEKEFPGIGMEIAWAIMPLVNQSLKNRLPELHTRLAKAYAKYFNADELQTLADFYTSPTGKKLVSGALENIQPKAMLEEAKKSKEMKITSAAVLSDMKDAVPTVIDAMNDADKAVLFRLATSGLLPRMKIMGPQIQEIQLQWMNESEPGEDEKMLNLVTAVIEKRQAAGK